MRELTTTLCLTFAVLFGGAGSVPGFKKIVGIGKYLILVIILTVFSNPAFAESGGSGGLESFLPLIAIGAVVFFILRKAKKNKKIKVQMENKNSKELEDESQKILKQEGSEVERHSWRTQLPQEARTFVSILASDLDKKTDQVDSVKVNFFIKYWKGDVSLPISYWVVSLSVALVSFSVFYAIALFLDSLKTFNPMIIFISNSIVYLMFSVLFFWQIIGVLRSSINHIKNPNKLSVWGYLAILVILGGVLENYEFYKTSLVPQFISLYKIAILSDPDIPQYEITVVENGKELLIKGGIKHGLLKDVERAIIRAPSITTINLESVGGRIGVAENLYDFISQRGFNTVTNKECLSACTIVFAAGKNRWVGINGRLGFHSGSFEGISELQANEGSRNIHRKISKEKGVPMNFLNKGNKVASKRMWYPSTDQLLRNNFITSKFSPAISSLRDMERIGIAKFKKFKSSLPKKLDRDTTLIDVRVKFNRITFIHNLSRNVSNRFQFLGQGWQVLERYVIKNACKAKLIRDELRMGWVFEYVYLDPTTNSKLVSFNLSKTCP